MIADDDDNFVSRWSRRKTAARTAQEKPAEPKPPSAPAPAATPVANAGAAPSSAPVPHELPPVDSLQGIASDYTDFLRPGVDPTLRRAALKKLFGDPHFNVMDGLDTYIDDYSKPDPIPEAMLKTLSHARGLLFGEEKNEEKKEAQTQTPREPGEKSADAIAEASHARQDAKPEAPVSAPAAGSKS